MKKYLTKKQDLLPFVLMAFLIFLSLIWNKDNSLMVFDIKDEKTDLTFKPIYQNTYLERRNSPLSEIYQGTEFDMISSDIVPVYSTKNRRKK